MPPWLNRKSYLDTKFLTKVTSVPPDSRRRSWKSSMKDRMRKIPLPEVRSKFSDLKPQKLFRHQILDQSYFGPPGLQAPQLEVVHEGPDEENTPAGSAQQVFRSETAKAI